MTKGEGRGMKVKTVWHEGQSGKVWYSYGRPTIFHVVKEENEEITLCGKKVAENGKWHFGGTFDEEEIRNMYRHRTSPADDRFCKRCLKTLGIDVSDVKPLYK